MTQHVRHAHAATVMIFVYIVLGLLVLVLAPLAIFFALLTVYTIFNAIVHRDSRPRRRSGSIDTLGISSDTSHPDITPHHGGHHHDSSGHHGGHHHDSSGHHGGHSDIGGHHTTSWTD
ncbi:hypothetical protein ACIRRA_42640 [Nocardia sp. NPDC101769]|uniref:hypothetical protein n=1 Tax=Nocardia sp. NPDC101769 TaxID=3364333 RepID=UPI00382073F0